MNIDNQKFPDEFLRQKQKESGENDQIDLSFLKFIYQIISRNKLIPGKVMSFYLQSFSSFQYKRILFIAPDRINLNVWMMLKKMDNILRI